jgi:hypothetical protein
LLPSLQASQLQQLFSLLKTWERSIAIGSINGSLTDDKKFEGQGDEFKG